MTMCESKIAANMAMCISLGGHRIINIVSTLLKIENSIRIHISNMHTNFEKDNSNTFGEIADNVFVFRHNKFVEEVALTWAGRNIMIDSRRKTYVGGLVDVRLEDEGDTYYLTYVCYMVPLMWGKKERNKERKETMIFSNDDIKLEFLKKFQLKNLFDYLDIVVLHASTVKISFVELNSDKN